MFALWVEKFFGIFEVIASVEIGETIDDSDDVANFVAYDVHASIRLC